jgi:hypothetical protein
MTRREVLINAYRLYEDGFIKIGVDSDHELIDELVGEGFFAEVDAVKAGTWYNKTVYLTDKGIEEGRREVALLAIER